MYGEEYGGGVTASADDGLEGDKEGVCLINISCNDGKK